MPDQFTQLLEWRRNEAAARALAKLPSDYYASTTVYLGSLRKSYESDLRENPSARKGEISRQTYQRASQVARDILESRMQKVLSVAFQASIGGSRDLPNALPEERGVFDRLLVGLLEHRRSCAPYLEPVGPTPAASAPTPSADPSPPARDPTPRPAPPPAAASGRSAVGKPVSYVRVVKDGAPIAVGPDTIDLRAEDVIALPPETAQLLVEAKIAEPLTETPIRPVT